MAENNSIFKIFFYKYKLLLWSLHKIMEKILFVNVKLDLVCDKKIGLILFFVVVDILILEYTFKLFKKNFLFLFYCIKGGAFLAVLVKISQGHAYSLRVQISSDPKSTGFETSDMCEGVSACSQNVGACKPADTITNELTEAIKFKANNVKVSCTINLNCTIQYLYNC